MKELRHHVEYSFPSRGGQSARLLDEQTDGARLVQQPQSPGLVHVLSVLWIHEHTAAHQDPVCFRDQRGDPAQLLVVIDDLRDTDFGIEANDDVSIGGRGNGGNGRGGHNNRGRRHSVIDGDSPYADER